jgi:hypothetical protein
LGVLAMKSWMCAAWAAASTSARGAGPAVGDVVFHRVVEQHRVLRHDADGRAQAGLRDLRMSWPSMVMRPPP